MFQTVDARCTLSIRDKIVYQQSCTNLS